MRGTFIKTLTEIAEKDPRVVLLTGDLGYMALEPFAEKFPERFYNVGVAEQNMVGVATGLAEAGYIPFCYSIVTFATLRPYEFIRNGPILHKLPVRIVGVGGGVEYGHNGATHYGLEDVGVMRVQPGINVIAPADAQQTRNALLQTYNLEGPTYYRLGKDDRAIVPGLEGNFKLGEAEEIRQGDELLIISMGSITTEAAAAVDELATKGVKASLLVVATLNPAPSADLLKYLTRYREVITIEAHYATGGLSSLVSEVIAQNDLNCKLTRCAIERTPEGLIGSQSYLYNEIGISKGKIVEKALKIVSGVKK
jgi:transketolase